MRDNWVFEVSRFLARSIVPRRLVLGFVLLAASMPLGCAGMTGETSFMTLSVDKKNIAEPLAEVRVGSVEIEPNAAFLRSVGSYPMGKFDDQDLKVFRISLQNSIASLQSSVRTDPNNKLNLHVLLRHHMVAHSNNEGSVLAAGAWCLVGESGNIAFQEGFFVSESGRHTVTIGAVKDALNESILQRIIGTVAQIASREGPTSIQSRQFPRTYVTYNEALTDLPQTLSATFLFTPTVGPEKIDWGWASDSSVDIDWERYLSARRK